MSGRKKRGTAEPERCPKCGFPELNTYARQTTQGFVCYTSCTACGHILDRPDAPAPETPAAAAPPAAPSPFALRTLVALQNRIEAVRRDESFVHPFTPSELALMSYALDVLSHERLAAGDRLTAEDEASMIIEAARAKPPIGVMPHWLWEEMHPEPSRVDLANRIGVLAHARERTRGSRLATLELEARLRQLQLDAQVESAFDRAVGWDGGPVACRRCTECRGQLHHWLTGMPECREGGEPFVPCKHCPAEAQLCERCGEGAVWPPRDDGWCEDCRDAVLDELDEELCSLLHRGDETGEHSPETHLALARARRGDGPVPDALSQPPTLAQQMDVFDVMLASYLSTLPAPRPSSPGRLLRDISVLELMEWHGARAREAAVAGEPAPFDPHGESPVELWRQWCSRDVSADDDGWAAFTNRVHAMLERRGIKP